MSVIAHNIIAIILICVSKGRGRARGPVVPCVVGYPSPPRPCGSLCVFHVLWVIAPAPPRLLRQEAWWEGGGIPWGTSTVTWMTCACLLSAGGGGAYHGGGGGPATRRRGTIYIYIYIFIWIVCFLRKKTIKIKQIGWQKEEILECITPD